MFQTLISSDDLKAHLEEGWLIVDCRFSLQDTELGAVDYRKSHIPGSVYAHLDRDLSAPVIPGVTGRHPLPERDVFAKLLGSWGLQPEMQVVVYDYGHGGIAARLWWMLKWMGHEAVAVLDGGWTQWEALGYPITDELPDRTATSYSGSASYHRTVLADEVEEIRSNADYVVIDSRAAVRYAGLEEPIDPVAGHIDGAVNRPFLDNLNEDGSWKSAEDLRADFSSLIQDLDDHQTVFYCGSGVTACHNILAFKHAGLGNAVLYPGSWSEWIHRLEG